MSTPTPEIERFVAGLLAIDGHRARLRALGERGGLARSDLLEALLGAGAAALRDDPREAGRRAQLALALAEETADAAERSRALCLRAKAALASGTFDLALESADSALLLARDAGDPVAASRLELLRVQALVPLERWVEAEQTGERVLARSEREGDERGVVLARMALADVAFRRDRPRVALRHYREVERRLPADAERMRGALAANRANALEAGYRFRAATRHFERALAVFRGGNREHTAAQVEYNLAYAEMLRGLYTDALRRYPRLEETFRRLGDERHVGHVNLDRAEIHVHLNLPEDAVEFAAAAEASFARGGLRKEQAQAAALAGRAAELAGRREEARAHLRRAEEAFAALGLDGRVFGCRLNRAGLAEQAGDRVRAAALADEAESLLGGRGDPLAYAGVELLRARLALASGDAEAAHTKADAVLERCRRIHAPWVRIEALRIRGRARADGDDLRGGIADYRRAVAALEGYRGGVPADEYMTAFLAGRAVLYHEIVALLLRAGEPEEAFGFVERAKSRALDDLMLSRHDGPAEPGEAGPSERRLRHLRERLHAVYQRMFHRGDGDARSLRFLAAARRRADEIEQEIAAIQRRRALRASPAAAAGRTPDLRGIREALDEDTAYLSCLVAEDELLVFLVKREGIHAVRTRTTRDEIEDRIGRFRYHLDRATRIRRGMEDLLLAATRANLADLADRLIGPIREHLDVRRLVVIPGGPLHAVPFHALPWEDGWMADRFEILYAPSAGIWARTRRETAAAGRPAVFGLPDEVAPRIGDEAGRVAALLDTPDLLLGEAATFERFRERARDSRILHVATHGMFRPGHPGCSAVRLADRWLNLYDLTDLRIGGELVVLSTCESGTADVSAGDEILGLSRGILLAGAPALIASQWTVDDAATAAFMDAFYEELARDGDVARSHRVAMRFVRRGYPHPCHWAPFFLTGRPVERPVPSPMPAGASAGRAGADGHRSNPETAARSPAPGGSPTRRRVKEKVQ